MKSHKIHAARLALAKFIARYPFEEIQGLRDKSNGGQIIAVDFSLQEVKLRDFCDYDVDEVVKEYSFKDSRINRLWKDEVEIYLDIINSL